MIRIRMYALVTKNMCRQHRARPHAVGFIIIQVLRRVSHNGGTPIDVLVLCSRLRGYREGTGITVSNNCAMMRTETPGQKPGVSVR